MQLTGRWSLPDFAIRRPVTVAMLTCTLVVVGMVCWTRLPLEFIIQLWAPTIWVEIPYPGAAPAQVEQEIIIPAEGVFKTIPGLRRLDAWSHENRGRVGLRFEFNANMAMASAEVRDRIERLKPDLPREVRHIGLGRFGPEDLPILHFALFRAENEDDLARYARRQLRNRLLRVPGVADVQVSGHTALQVYVDFDANALQSLGLGITEVVNALHASHVNLSIGRLHEGQFRYLVRAQDEFSNTEELANAIVHPSGIRLREVSEINEQLPRGADSFTVDGQRGVFIRVVKEASANTVATCRAVVEEMHILLEEPELEGADFLIFEDQSEYITFALNSLILAGQYGCIMAFIVLWLFLRRVRATLLVACAIPTALVLAPVYIYFAGKSLNIITIAAMLISIGILVDNAIVVIENIHRRQQRYPGRKDNVSRGASEVALAITAATFTTLIVFVPVFYMEEGELSTIMREFAGPITSALLASLVLALTVLPAAAHYFGEERPVVKEWLVRRGWVGDRPGPPRGPLFHLTRVYRAVLAKALHRKLVPVALILVVLALTRQYPVQNTGYRGFPEMDMRRVTVNFRVDANYGADNARADVQQLVVLIERERERLQVRNLYVNSGGWGGAIDVYLKKPQELAPGQEIAYSTDEARRFLHDMLPERVPGGRISTGVPSTQPDSSRTVRVRFTGEDLATLEQLAEDFRRQLEGVEGLINARTSLDEGRDEIQLLVDNERAAQTGITATAIARSVSFALGGTDLPTLRDRGEERTVRGRYAWTDRGNPGDLEAMALPAEDGTLVPLAQLTEFGRGKTPQSLYRSDARSRVDVEADTDAENLLGVRRTLETMAANFVLPRGYTVTVDESLREIDDILANFIKTVLLAAILIYLLLAALFESWLMPLSVLTTVPLAFVGVYWSLYLSGSSLDSLSLVGGIILCGIIVNNGIVIVDHINQLRAAGMERTAAVLEGGGNRLRPVLMTTSTTILGVLPLAYGAGSDGGTGALDSLGRALVGGLAAGTFLTLFAVPLAYVIVDDVRTWSSRYFGSLATIGR